MVPQADWIGVARSPAAKAVAASAITKSVPFTKVVACEQRGLRLPFPEGGRRGLHEVRLVATVRSPPTHS
jgi:hypothetical protein